MKKCLLFALSLLCLVSCAGEQGSQYYPKPKKAFRIMTYNVGSLSKFMENSTDMVAAMINEIDADLVGLNELDSCNTRHSVNQVAELAKAVGGWNWSFGRAMPYRGGAYGNGVIVPAKVTIIDSYTLALPAFGGPEPRSVAVIETPDYVYGSCHLQHKSDSCRVEQAKVVNEWFSTKYAGYSKPVFFGGDMNAHPDSEPLKVLGEVWEVLSSMENSIPVKEPRVCIDYVFHLKGSAPVQVLGSRTMSEFDDGDATIASDHLPVYVDVKF